MAPSCTMLSGEYTRRLYREGGRRRRERVIDKEEGETEEETTMQGCSADM